MGELAGGEIDRQAEYTDRQARPVLETYNRQGDVVNHVLYNPLYEESAPSGVRPWHRRLQLWGRQAPLRRPLRAPLPAQRVGPRTRLPGDADGRDGVHPRPPRQ